MKTRSTLFLLVLLPVVIAAQAIDTSKIDVSQAQAFPAGPDRVYVRGILYDGNPVSVVLSYDGDNGAQVIGPYTDDQKLISDNIDLSYTRFGFTDNGDLRISDVIIGDTAYTGLFAQKGDTGLGLESYVETALPETDKDLMARIERERQDLENRIASANAERDKAVAERDTAAAERDKAVSDLQNAQNASNTLGSAQSSALPDRVLFRGFRQGKALMGTWNATAEGVTQTDPVQKLSAYAVEIPEISQVNSDTLISFTAGAGISSGWNGFGMHFAKSAEGQDVFGFGNTFLLWVNADTVSGGAFLQLYQTGDRIRQIASYRLSDAMPETLRIGLLYRPSSGDVQIYTNGKLAAEFDGAGISLPGTTLILRTFGGPVTFSDFTVDVK